MRLGHWRSRVARDQLADTMSSGRNATRSAENTRREPIFMEFIDLASKGFADALLQTSIQDPSKVILLYATMGKLRLFASERTVEATEKAIT
jgi:hypothetical protein